MVIPPTQPALMATAFAHCVGELMKSVPGKSALSPGSGVERLTLAAGGTSSALCKASWILNALVALRPAAARSTLKLMPQAASPARLLRQTDGSLSQLGAPRGEAQVPAL